ncbi:MAG: glycosyltransferase family 2 protein [Elusimicrobiota bacterium]
MGYIIKKIKTLAVIGAIILILYYLSRTFFFFISDYSWMDRIFGGMLLIGETYILVHAFGFLLSVFRVHEDYRIEEFGEYCFIDTPPVAVIVAARHEPKEILADTFTTIYNLDYPKKNIYLLDDSSEEKYIKEADELAEEFNIEIFRRKDRHGAKAGIVNDFIRNMDEKYVAIFDADQNPMPDFLYKTVYFMEQNLNLAFVQTPQFYTNIEVSPIAKGATIQQAIFYEAICESKSFSNAMFCCGTNVVFRKTALDEVGGFDEENITEDFATSVKLHSAGYESFYYNKVSAFGMAPESLPAYFKQQTRWAAGTISVFRRLIGQFFTNITSLTSIQWWEYFLAATYYFIGWAFFLLMISPIAYLGFDVPSFFLHPAFYIGIFVPYYVLSMLIFYSSMLRRNYNFSMVYKGTILGMLSFPILMKAAVYGLFNKKMTFNVTAKGKIEKMSFLSLWPYHIMILLNILAVSSGFFRIYNGEDIYALGVNIFWAVYHIFILSHIYYFNRVTENTDE